MTRTRILIAAFAVAALAACTPVGYQWTADHGLCKIGTHICER